MVVDLATLLGLAQTPAEIPGLGPVPADIARALAAEGSWRAWVTDPATRQITVTGSRTYTPSAAVARLVRAQEQRCRMPGCGRRAIDCDLDHTEPWPAGRTEAANLGPLCRTDHNLKTHHGYHLANLDQAHDKHPLHAAPDSDATDNDAMNSHGAGASAGAGPAASPGGGPAAGCGAGPGASPAALSGWQWTMPSGLSYRDSAEAPLVGPQ